MKNKVKYPSFYCIVLLLICACGREQTVQCKIYDLPSISSDSVTIKEELRLGADDITKPDYMFGYISDIAIDDQDNIYVLDHINMRAVSYSSTGEIISRFGNGKGQGPGEFQDMHNICVDATGSVYITDSTQRTVTIFDPKGKFVNEFLLEGRLRPLNDIAVVDDKYILVGFDANGFSQKWPDGLFMKYELPNILFSGFVGKATWFKKNWRTMTTSCTVFVDKIRKNVVVAHAFPYEIEVFSEDFKLQYCFGRRVERYEEIVVVNEEPLVKMTLGASLAMTRTKEGYFVHFIRHPLGASNKLEDQTISIDLFDENGRFLCSLPKNKFGIDKTFGIKVEADHAGAIWITQVEPYPQVVKYSIHVAEKPQ